MRCDFLWNGYCKLPNSKGCLLPEISQKAVLAYAPLAKSLLGVSFHGELFLHAAELTNVPLPYAIPLPSIAEECGRLTRP